MRLDEITVPATTLEQVMEEKGIERIDFLKLDCQGQKGQSS
jgi:FkbM family methyltransferase